MLFRSEMTRRLRLLGSDHVHHGVDQRQVGEGLRKVSEMPTGAMVDLLRVELERAGVPEQSLAQMLGAGKLADLHESRHQPERADRERAFLSRQSVVGGVNAIAQNQTVLGEFVRDGENRGADSLVLGGQESEQRSQQQ